MFQIARKITVRSVLPVVGRFSGNAQKFTMQRNFSSQLHGLLVREFKEELNHNEPNEELNEVKAEIEKSFKIEEKTGESVVYLRSEFKGEEIQIKFDCQDEQEGEEEFDENEYDEEAEKEKFEAAERGEEVDEPSNAVTLFGFEVTIKKPDGSRLEIDCYTGKEQFQIQHVGYVAAGTTDITPLYTGPKFQDLDEKLVEGFYSYLEARKINDDLNFFVASYCFDKERREYINWLKTVSDFVYSKPQLK